MRVIPFSRTPADPGSNLYVGPLDSDPIDMTEIFPEGTRGKTLWYRKILNETGDVDIIKIYGAPTAEALEDEQGAEILGIDGEALDFPIGGDGLWFCVVLGADYPFLMLHLEVTGATNSVELFFIA